jgi:hypothetical protein
VAPRLKVIADEDAFKSVVFRGEREMEQLAWTELFG